MGKTCTASRRWLGNRRNIPGLRARSVAAGQVLPAILEKTYFFCPFWGILGIFTTSRGVSRKTVIFPGPGQEQLGESRPRYLTNSQPRPPIIMIIIDATHLHLSIIIIIIGGRGCELVRYRGRDSPSCSWLGPGKSGKITVFRENPL